MTLWRATRQRQTFGFLSQRGVVMMAAPYLAKKIVGRPVEDARQFLIGIGFSVERLDK